jgi:hypothetical protein
MNWVKLTAANKKQKPLKVNLDRAILIERDNSDESTRIFFKLSDDHVDVEETPDQILKAGKANT